MEWSTIISLTARHLLTTAAGWLVAHGLIGPDPSATEAFVGAGMVLAGIAWSAWQKWGQVLIHRDTATAKGIPPSAVSAP